MEEINKAVGGLNTDVSPAYQPAHTVRDMQNLLPMSTEGNLSSLENCDGNALTSVSFPDGFKPIGHYLLNTDLIVILATATGESQIGIIKETVSGFEYEGKAPVDSNGNVPSTNKEFGFSLNHPAQCEARKLIDGHRVLYYTDNVNPPGRVDLDNPPAEGTVQQEAALVPDMKVPDISFTVSKGGGRFRPGKVHIVTRYETDSGGLTNFGLAHNGIDIYKGTSAAKAEGGYTETYLNAEGEELEDDIVTKSYNIKFDNVDTTYKSLHVIAVSYIGNIDPVQKATKIAELPITSDSLFYTLNTLETEDAEDISLAEVNLESIPYNRAKTIAQKDNTLFLGGLSASTAETVNFQEIANKVKVTYQIEELPYSNREGGASSDVYSDATVSGTKQIKVRYTSRETKTGSGEYHNIPTEATDFFYTSNNDLTLGEVTLDNANIVEDDTLIFSLTDPSETVTFTFKDEAIDPEDVLIGASSSETASNLQRAIIDSNVDSRLQAFVDDDNDSLLLFYTTDFDDASVASSAGLATQTKRAGGTNTAGTIMLVTVLQEAQSSSGTASGSSSTDYSDEVVIAEKRGYRRREVYSLSFGFLYNNGSTSPVYHIPGDFGNISNGAIDGTDNKFPASNWGGGSGDLGTFRSVQEYPKDESYPGNDAGDDQTVGHTDRYIYHHVMPSLSDEPHVRTDPNGKVFIRAIGLNFEFTEPIPSEALENVQEILFFRESRSPDGNKSVVAQGIVDQMTNIAIDYKGEDDNDVLLSGTTSTIDGSQVDDAHRVIPR